MSTARSRLLRQELLRSAGLSDEIIDAAVANMKELEVNVKALGADLADKAGRVIKLRAVIDEWEQHGTMCNFGPSPCGNCQGCEHEGQTRKMMNPSLTVEK